MSGGPADLFQHQFLSGRADPEGTLRYFEETARTYRDFIPEAWYRRAPGTDWTVSRLGFGAYRVAKGIRSHFDSLREALLSGVNVIDTAGNYGNGASESLIGDVVHELIDARRIERENIVVVGKAGYIQGRNLEYVRAHPDRYGGLVKYRPDCWHCIHPDFLTDQVELSRRRLGLEVLDVLLLHNPEHYLIRAREKGVPAKEARDEFDLRMDAALERLEQLRSEGRIQYYGVSSNSLAFNRTEYAATHLDRMLKHAPPGFKVIQFPANLIENEYRFNRSASGGAVAEQALDRELWSLGNRPLNAAIADRGLFRLARLVDPPPDEGATTIAEMNRMQGRIEETEGKIIELFRDRHFQFDQRTPPFSALIREHRDEFLIREQLLAALPPVARRMRKTLNHISRLADSPDGRYALENYTRLCNLFLGHWRRYINFRRHERLAPLREGLGKITPALRDKPLAVQSILSLLTSPHPQTVLVGMHTLPYVRQLRTVFQSPPPAESEQLKIIAGFEDLMEELLKAEDENGPRPVPQPPADGPEPAEDD